MSYRNTKPNNTTLIDDLPDVEEIELPRMNGLEMIPDSNKFQKYIRNNNYNPSSSSGMKINSQPYDPYKIGFLNNDQGSYIDSSPHKQMYPHSSGGLAPNTQMFYEPYTSDSLSCKDIANHTLNCPVCSRLYSNDKTIYNIVIIVLSIIIIFLLKRVLDM